MPYPAYETIPIPAVHAMDLIHDGKMKREEDEIVIYPVGGMPTEDVAWGTKIYRNALEKGIGTKLNLWEKPDLA